MGAGVLAALDLDGDEGKEQEEHGHAEAHPIHRLVAHQHITVHVALNAWDGGAHSPFAKAWYLHDTQHNPATKQPTDRANLIWARELNATCF